MFDLDAYLERIGLARPSGDWSELALTGQTPTGRTVTPVELGAIPQLLEGRFGLAGFTLDGGGRVVAV